MSSSFASLSSSYPLHTRQTTPASLLTISLSTYPTDPCRLLWNLDRLEPSRTFTTPAQPKKINIPAWLSESGGASPPYSASLLRRTPGNKPARARNRKREKIHELTINSCSSRSLFWLFVAVTAMKFASQHHYLNPSPDRMMAMASGGYRNSHSHLDGKLRLECLEQATNLIT